MAIEVMQRPAEQADFERVGDELTRFTVSKGAPAYGTLSYLFQAAVDGKPAAELICTVHNWGNVELDLVFVDEAFRGQGVGTNLVSAAEDFVKAQYNASAIRLYTPTWQGVGFYERLGYAEMGRIPLNVTLHGERQYNVTYYKNLIPE